MQLEQSHLHAAEATAEQNHDGTLLQQEAKQKNMQKKGVTPNRPLIGTCTNYKMLTDSKD